MIVRCMTIQDVERNKDEIRELLRECIQGSYKPMNMENVLNGKIENMKYHISHNSGYVISAFIGLKVCGLIWAYLMDTMEGKVFHLAYVSVLSEYQKNGVAKQLMAETEVIAKQVKADKMELIVSPYNREAYCLYQKCGFDMNKVTMGKNL